MPSASYPRVPGCLTQVRLHLGDPVALESVRRSLSQQNRLSHLVPLPPESQASGSSVSHTQKIRLTSLAPTPEEDDNYSNRAPISSRSSSQRKALNRFTRELEKFAAVTNTQGRPPLFTPTLTVTPHSLNTIQELLPYREEFQAAGLAVTSAEQGSPRKATERDRSRSVIFFDGKVEAHEPEKCSSNSNESSNDTVIHFSEPTALTFALAKARKSILNKEDKSHHCDHRIPEQERSPDIEIGENSLKPRSPCPELPDTWKYAVTTPSSFEKALDEVVRKLEDMGECSRTSLDPAKEKSAGRRLSGRATPVERLQKASELRRQKLQGRSSGHQTPVPPFADKVSVMSREDPTVDHEDRDIDDRDVLKGLKIAISAACDEELDAWIRVKTGLRLRRFLADLKTFENLSEDNVLAAKGGQGARQSTAERRNRRAVSASTKK
ncbi:hypothetical protein GQ53DRAFT_829687 [Thozetella sp. PMI_491]|nr:hypothetical protein GQ53DRAFT_829687 [Thozetella sp. PMI_491]